jgi:O-antigen ligase
MLLQLLLIEKIQWRWKHFIAYSLAFVLAMWIGVYQNPVLKMKVEQTTGVFSGNYTQTDVATSGRLPIWRTAINVIKSNWINGIGPRGFRYVYSEYAEKGDPYVAKNPHVGPTHPHQMFLEIATETGLLGVIGYLIAQFYWLQLGLVAVRAKMSAVLPWMTAVLIAIMPINSHMAFYASFWSSITWWLIMISLAYWQADFLEKKSSQS